MATLIADSGSTKTDWVVSPLEVIHTQGINPIHQSPKEILAVLRNELLPYLTKETIPDVRNVCFYGSGVRPELETMMEDILHEAFPGTERVEAHSDMLGAARAVCGWNEGIAAILGTGANSCLYDGECVVANTPALGYVLGDEGSGAVLGRLFLNAVYKGTLSKEIKNSFEVSTGLTMVDIINKVYRQPLANRFLASLSEFIHGHLDDVGVRQIVIDNFRDFFQKNILPYGRRDLPVSFVGSIAWHYQRELYEAAATEGFAVGTVVKSPLDGLVTYHRWEVDRHP